MSLIDIKSLKCPACGAPYTAGQQICAFCQTPLPQQAAPDQLTDVAAFDGSEEIVDYYALIGMTSADQPGTQEIEVAALMAQERHLLNPYIRPEQRKPLTEEIEVAAWILSDERARREYDSILLALQTGMFNDGHIGMLGELQRQAREALGLHVDQTAPEELLQQGVGYQALGMHQEAIAVLKRAVEALPDSAEAHYRYAQAILSFDDPLSKGGHELRQAYHSFHTAAQIDSSLLNAAAYAALCQGLIERQYGDKQKAQAELQRAVQLAPDLGVAWRALAAQALQEGDHNTVKHYCRRALLSDPQDERVYILLVASCWRAGQQNHAREAAQRVAELRGAGTTAEQVLHEVLGL